MDGAQQITETVLEFGKDGLKINANSDPKQARVMAWLKKSVFEDYKELGAVGLGDLQNVVNVLGRFGDTISLKKEGNLLTVKDKTKSVGIELVAENFLTTDTGEPKLEFEETFGLTATRLKSVFDDIKLNKDAVMTFKTEQKKVVISNTGRYKFVNEIPADTCKGGVKVDFGDPFIDATKNLDGNLEISLKTSYPAKVMEKTETSVITIIVAPRVEEQ